LAALDLALEASLQAEVPAVDSRVAVAIGEHRYLIAVEALDEISVVPAISRLGQMPAAVVGLANFRGAPRTLLDAPAFLGLGQLDDPGAAWAMMLRSEEVGVALLWPTLHGLFPISAFTADGQLPTLPYAAQTYTDAQGQRWHELDVPAVLTQLRRAPAKETA